MDQKIICGAFYLAAQSAWVPALAQSTTEGGLLKEVSVQAVAGDDEGYHSAQSPGVSRSSVPLSEQPQAITVVPRALLDSQQALSLGDALYNVAGVVSQNFGRRGWDDLIIRGQTASDAVFIDGLRTAGNNRVAQELFGVDSVEVLKGPASLLYGRVLPGGLVSLNSKRPSREAGAATEATVGSYGLRQTTFDVNQPLGAQGKAALRLTGLVMNSDDATDHVYFKNRYVAPALSLDFGARTDFTLLASHQERQYVRQQGLPLSGSVLSNAQGLLPLSRFTGETTQRPYDGEQSRLGYALTHRFDSGWTLNQNLRHQTSTLSGQLTAISSLAADGVTLRRSVTDQQYDGRNDAVDTQVQKTVDTAWGAHELTWGADYARDTESTLSKTCTVASLNVYQPVYGATITCPASYRTNSLVTTRSLGFYARDQWRLTPQVRVVLGLRREQLTVTSANRLSSVTQSNPASATTGSAALMVEVLPGVRPYLSYATSFFPNTGLDAQNQTFAPESGRQLEAGLKWDLGPRSTVTTAVYDLRRRNVLQTDPNNSAYSVAVGEQRTQGGELSVAAELGDGLSLFGGYAYTDARITEAGAADAATVGQALNNVPLHSFTLSSRYRFRGDWRGWELNGGARGQGPAHAYTYALPGYTVADVGVAYNQAHWRVAFNIKNLLDQRYFVGGVAAAVAVGTPRTAMLTVGYRY